MSSFATERVKPMIAGLGRRVVRMAGASLDAADRRHVHDRAASRAAPSTRAAARVPWNVPSRCTASSWRHSSSVIRTSASSGVFDRPGGLLGALGLEQRRDAPQVRAADRARVVDEDVQRPERSARPRRWPRRRPRCRSRPPRGRGRRRRHRPSAARRRDRCRAPPPARPPRQAACRSRGRSRDPPPVTAATLPSSLMSGTRLRHGDEPAAHGAGLEALVGRGHVGEPHALDLDVDRAGARERDDLRELGARAPVREDDRRLERARRRSASGTSRRPRRGSRRDRRAPRRRRRARASASTPTQSTTSAAPAPAGGPARLARGQAVGRERGVARRRARRARAPASRRSTATMRTT